MCCYLINSSLKSDNNKQLDNTNCDHINCLPLYEIFEANFYCTYVL